MSGTYYHSLDDKARVIIPAKLREALTEHFWMTLDENDNVALYSEEMWERLLTYCRRQVAENPHNEALAAAMERLVAYAEDVTVDNNSWRIPIAEVLRERAQLGKEIVTVGLIDHAVLWAKEKYDAQKSGRLDHEEVRRAQASLRRGASYTA